MCWRLSSKVFPVENEMKMIQLRPYLLNSNLASHEIYASANLLLTLLLLFLIPVATRTYTNQIKSILEVVNSKDKRSREFFPSVPGFFSVELVDPTLAVIEAFTLQ